MSAMVEQQAQGFQLHALGGQRLVDFMGHGCRHLPQRGQLGRLHQPLLGGAQLTGALLDLALELLPAALAQAGQAQALADEQRSEHQAQPHGGGAEGGIATVGGHLRLAQQMQGPVFTFQRQAFPQVLGAALRALHAAEGAVVGKAGQHLVLQRHQRLLVVLTGFGQFGTVGTTEWLQFAVAPAVLVGDEGDAAGIADQQDVAALAPLAFQLGKLQLHHHGAEEAAMLVVHRAGEEVARHATGHAHGVEAATALAAGLLEVGAETVVGAHVAAGQTPVAGGDGQAGAVEQFEGGGVGGAIDAFELAVQGVLHRFADRATQGGDQFRVQRQHGGQGAVAVDQRVQGIGIQAQLLAGTLGVGFHGLALGLVHGPTGAEGGAQHDQQGDQPQTQGANGKGHGADPDEWDIRAGLFAGKPAPTGIAQAICLRSTCGSGFTREGAGTGKPVSYSSSKLCCCTAWESSPTWTLNSPGSATRCSWPL
ncbi:hypothetical protein D3C78_859380 [compost metagenome]